MISDFDGHIKNLKSARTVILANAGHVVKL
jgi:hypothetical protein